MSLSTLIRKTLSLLVLTAFISLTIVPPGIAGNLPEDWSWQAGNGSITVNGKTMDISQLSDQAIINWLSYCIAQGYTVNYHQPGSGSICLNRVTGGSISEIFGALNANGQVWLLNPNGILFGPTAKINTAGFMASTLNMTDESFLSKAYVLTKSANSTGYIINQGEIIATRENGEPGYVTLLGQAVHNEGIIQAKLGKVTLGAGEKMTLELDNNGMMSVAIDGPVTEKVKDKNGDVIELEDAVSNTGTIQVDGGSVILTADVLGDVFENAVNNEGVIKAGSLVDNGGEIYLLAEGENQKVINSGLLDASAIEEGADGGIIEMEADYVENAGTILARGSSNAKGGNVNLSSEKETLLKSGSKIDASGVGESSNGGDIIVKSEGDTIFEKGSRLISEGGDISGDGGFIEASAKKKFT